MSQFTPSTHVLSSVEPPPAAAYDGSRTHQQQEPDMIRYEASIPRAAMYSSIKELMPL